MAPHTLEYDSRQPMHQNLKVSSIHFIIILAAGMAATNISSQAQNATASLMGIPAGPAYNYTLTLTNIGSTPLNSLWYGWTTSGNNLPSVPTTPGNSLGWHNGVFGNSIEWINSTGTALAPGQSGVFTFVSTSTPIQITTLPSGQSVAYVNGIDSTENFPGHSSPVFSPTLGSVPEPSSFVLALLGSLGWLVARRKAPRRSGCHPFQIPHG
ncbi:MAG: hypothetical protein QOJ40_2799 [Verrucomicrobiota bacterium]